MQDEVKNMRATKAPEMLRALQARHSGSGLNSAQWDEFLLVYKGDIDKALSSYIVWADQEIAQINGVPEPLVDPNAALIGSGEDLATVQLARIKAEMTRLEQFISADTVIRNQYAALTSRIAQENGALKALDARLSDAHGAVARRKTLQAEREASYGRVFEAITSEHHELLALYAPLMARLAGSPGTLSKLTFSASRVVDAATWPKPNSRVTRGHLRRKQFLGLGVGTVCQIPRLWARQATSRRSQLVQSEIWNSRISAAL